MWFVAFSARFPSLQLIFVAVKLSATHCVDHIPPSDSIDAEECQTPDVSVLTASALSQIFLLKQHQLCETNAAP